jgi:hypothetical protein
MSEAAVYRQARGFVLGMAMERRVRVALNKALEAALPANLQFFWEMGSDAGVTRERLRARCVALFFLFAWANLTDDLVDGDAEYLEEPQKEAPILLFLLRSAVEMALGEGDISRRSWCEVNRLLWDCASLGMEEIREGEWDCARWMRVARGISGLQHAAYLRLLWEETLLEGDSYEIGIATGLLTQYIHDLRAQDTRIFSMKKAEQEALYAEMRACAIWLQGMAEKHNLKGLSMFFGAMGIEKILEMSMEKEAGEKR